VTPAVSIVLPTFNRLQYLRSAVESVFTQTFQDWELIIVDDGSEEETCSFLKTLATRPRVRIVWLSHTGNPAAVRNAGVLAAQGDYIAFLDSDDLWMATKLERQIDSLTACAACRWSYTGYVLIDDGGATRPYPATRQWIPYRGAILERLLAHEPEIWTPAVLVERQLLHEVGGFDEQLPLFEDYDLWLRLACRSEIDVIDEPLIGVRLHDQHYSRGGIEMLASRHRSLGELRRWATDRRLRAVIGGLHAQSTVELASVCANTDRIAAARLLLSGWTHAWRYSQWWARLPRAVLKMAVPRTLLDLYRRSRSRLRANPTCGAR
jgi:glycosyltransferase involved in cell wall biosynthesis